MYASAGLLRGAGWRLRVRRQSNQSVQCFLTSPNALDCLWQCARDLLLAGISTNCCVEPVALSSACVAAAWGCQSCGKM